MRSQSGHRRSELKFGFIYFEDAPRGDAPLDSHPSP
jgi:hypothetical protein